MRTQNFILKTPGSYDELDIRCPRCSSNEIVVYTDPKGYYKVIECYNCGFKDKKN